ncbi:hypothetical protein ABID22_000558 [Pontibacter aydingkolensis]|uniref:Lipocalin-like domain-containing protein n=1 Tax=Pontibacter aydingkolensis TaxID=1911536 RepID=A0ABS7CRZ4_9BACT|nr:hypothetical protein [Pontibacter aydingkolensis]MBW7466560.1 hypothetical protein [Pontibacter aydingkolensis]
MKAYFILFSLALFYTLASFTAPKQENNYSIIGSWKLTDIQFNADGATELKTEKLNPTLAQSKTRFVYESTGQFKLVLSEDGRGLQGGYHYDRQNNILSIKYGSHTDTALVSWINADKMVHMTKDGKTRMVLERE